MAKKGFILGGGVILLIVSGWLFTGNRFDKTNSKKIKEREVKEKIEITSLAFKNGGWIPVEYTCEGKDINPPLKIKDVPEQTKSLVIMIEDPDAPFKVWDHWIVYNIDPAIRQIPEGQIPKGGQEIKNSFGKLSYGGPCPPPGKAHRYFFKVYALDTVLDKISNKQELFKAMQGHIVGFGQLMGKFKR